MMHLVAQKKYLETLGRPARIIVEPAEGDDISGAVLGTASREDASLVVLQSEPGPWLLGAFLENRAVRMLRHSTLCDILLFPACRDTGTISDGTIARDLFDKILIPVSFSSFDREACVWASRLNAVGEIVLLHVIPDHAGTARDSAFHEKERELLALGDAIGRENLNVTVVVREGDPAREICRVAQEQSASLILMPRSGLAWHVSGGELGSTVAGVANHPVSPLLVRRPHTRLSVQVRELPAEEFSRAEELWVHYHNQKADRANDRIFAVYPEDTLVSVAWCKRHPDGLEVDGVFTLEAFRNHGYARRAVETLIAACGGEPLFMHATLELVEFYSTLGFVPIPEDELPPTIKERFAFALGNLEGANACPMRRVPVQAHDRDA
jgi:nucleotide-binding universal stress UspA family protein/GNAT superfamily N-acetyltransferase